MLGKVRLVWCPPYFNKWKAGLPYYSRMVSGLFHLLSALFQDILTLVILYALIQQSAKSVHLITAVTKKVSALLQENYVRLIPTYLILKKCLPYYSNLSTLLQDLGVRLIPTPGLSTLLQHIVCLNVGTSLFDPWHWQIYLKFQNLFLRIKIPRENDSVVVIVGKFHYYIIPDILLDAQ